MSLRVIHTQGDTALVRNGSEPSFPVRMMDWLKFLVCVGDIAIIKRSPVSGEWIMTDYIRQIDEIGGEVNE